MSVTWGGRQLLRQVFCGLRHNRNRTASHLCYCGQREKLNSQHWAILIIIMATYTYIPGGWAEIALESQPVWQVPVRHTNSVLASVPVAVIKLTDKDNWRRMDCFSSQSQVTVHQGNKSLGAWNSGAQNYSQKKQTVAVSLHTWLNFFMSYSLESLTRGMDLTQLRWGFPYQLKM